MGADASSTRQAAPGRASVGALAVGPALVLAIALSLAGCGVLPGAAAEREREGLRDRAAGRTSLRASAGAPVPGTLVPAPRLDPAARVARRPVDPQLVLPGSRDEAAAAGGASGSGTTTAASITAASPVASPVARRDEAKARVPDPRESFDGWTASAMPIVETYDIDLELPRYRPGANLAGEIRTVGSSTLTTLLNTWSEEFERIQGRIALQITGGGSAAAIRPFVAGESDLAPMAREMSAREIGEFRSRWGYEPTRFTVALDAIAVYVNKVNPLPSLTLAQLDSIYAIEPRRGLAAVRIWGDLGVPPPLADKPIQRYGPRRSQGIHSVFRALVLQDGDSTLQMSSEPVSSAVVQAAGADEAGIAFASRLFASHRTRMVPIATAAGGATLDASAQNITADRYPLARRLYIYANRPPTGGLPIHVAEFLRYVCSFEGQERLARSGGIAMSREISEAECAGRL